MNDADRILQGCVDALVREKKYSTAKAADDAVKLIRVFAKVRWLSCEPLIEPLHFAHLDRFDLVVIGGASRSSKTPKWIPPFTWLDDLMRQAKAAGCGVFLKSNLYLKEQPIGGARYQFADRAPDVFHYLAKASAPDQRGPTPHDRHLPDQPRSRVSSRR